MPKKASPPQANPSEKTTRSSMSQRKTKKTSPPPNPDTPHSPSPKTSTSPTSRVDDEVAFLDRLVDYPGMPNEVVDFIWERKQQVLKEA